MKELKDGDSIKLVRYQYQFLSAGLENQIIAYAIVKNNSFSFDIELIGNIERCRLYLPERLGALGWDDGILESGCDLSLAIKNNQLVFSKKGAAIVNYHNLLDSIYNSNVAGINWQGGMMEKNMEIIKKTIQAIQATDGQNPRYMTQAFSAVRLQKTIGLVSILYSIAYINKGAAQEYMRKIDTDLYDRYIKPLSSNKDLVNIPSASWISLVASRYGSIFKRNHNKSERLTKVEKDNEYIAYLKDNFKGQILSQLIAAFIYYNRQADTFTTNYITSITKDIDFSRYQNLLKGIQKFSPGTVIPEFTLTDTSGNEVPLSQFKGNVLVLDFWFTGCGACAIAYKILDPIIKGFEGQPVKLISISRDSKLHLWLKSIHGGLYTDPKHINLSGGKQGDSHPLFRYLQVSGYPTIIIIDKNGKIIGSPRKLVSDQGSDLKNKIEKALNNNL
ncbi:TlpA family protein disulfide reductase [Chryseobacterium sp. c4a]|uniref:TlpA family protein disulfide reductase n=1 Tax=Chryseobacterium sp. c4a TaxID=1573582 RepID=UPI001357C239|nr:TlpA disulfide reductase family protein [Chryseobacterium sp. c4a]